MMGGGVDHQKVPFWIGTDCKLVSGISKSTTCQDVIRSLVHSHDSSNFAIVEKWRKMERKLDPSVRILKVWKAWGDQKNDVALILRPQHTSAADGYIDKRISHKVLRRKSSVNHHKFSNQAEESDEEGRSPPMESMQHLLKLVLTQGETIQAQLKKLRQQEEQIERYEENMHRVRSLENGENYVVESYLRDEKSRKSNSSSRKRDKSPRKPQDSSGRSRHHLKVPEPEEKQQSSGNPHAGACSEPPSCPATLGSDSQEGIGNEELSSVEILEQNELLERICEVNVALTREEERLLKLGFKLKKFHERRSSVNTTKGEVPTTSSDSREEVIDFQGWAELEALRNVTNEQAREIERNEETLTQLETFLNMKQEQISQLSFLMEQMDQESQILQHRLHQFQQTSSQRDFEKRGQQSSDVSPHQRQELQTKNSMTVISSSPSSEDSLVHCQCLMHPCSNQTGDSKKICRDHHDTDSNSDTGISSLHSSGDENTLCVLDTLV